MSSLRVNTSTATTITTTTTSVTATNTNTTSFTIAIHLVLAHREQFRAVSSRSSYVALFSFLGKVWGWRH